VVEQEVGANEVMGLRQGKVGGESERVGIQWGPCCASFPHFLRVIPPTALRESRS